MTSKLLNAELYILITLIARKRNILKNKNTELNIKIARLNTDGYSGIYNHRVFIIAHLSVTWSIVQCVGRPLYIHGVRNTPF